MTRRNVLLTKIRGHRHLRKALIVGTLILALPAQAQMTNCTDHGAFLSCHSTDGSFTNCNKVGNMLNCHRMGGNQPDTNQSYNNNGGAANGMADFFHSIKIRRARARVAKALRAGDCPAALDAALATSDFDYVQAVQSYCAQAGTSPGYAP